MKKYLLLLLLFYAVIPINCDRETPSLADTPEEKVFTVISGPLSGVLKEDDSPYQVNENIKVESQQELIIEPGTRIFFSRKSKFIVEGNLIAAGNKNYPVVFTAFSDSGWAGILFNGSLSSELRFCRIEKINVEYDDNNGNGAVFVNGSDLKMNNCTVENNRAVNGGGLYITSSTVKIHNNIIRMNYTDVFGGGILCFESTAEIINNLISENDINAHGGAAVLVNNDTSIIQNNIFWKNTIRYGDAQIMITESEPGVIDTAYNYLNRTTDPKFISEIDFHLELQSPCRNAGNPSPEFNDHDGTRNDQGAYGGPLGGW